MAVVIKGGKLEPSERHDCLDEIGHGRYEGVHDRTELPVGSISRCSCGRLWRARSYAYDASRWEWANIFFRLLYWNQGYSKEL